MKHDLLIALPLDDERRAHLGETYTVHYAPTPEMQDAAIASVGGRVRAVLANGSVGLTGERIRAMPNLGIICNIGAGYENIDVAAARERGIPVTHGSGTNAATVVDHAIALLFSVVRGIPRYDSAMREGWWKEPSTCPPMFSGRRMGILGLGDIGSRIAQRGACFEMPIGYHNRSRRNDVPFAYFPTVTGLAAWCDFFIVTCPGGKETYHLVDSKVLAALGPSGYLVNVARGSIVDTDALVGALRSNAIAGAAIDVFEDEPEVSRALFDLRNVVLSPHLSGRSSEALKAQLDLALGNLRAHFAGEPLITPVLPAFPS